MNELVAALLLKKYGSGGGGGSYPEPTGTIEITQNGTGIDVKDYAEADVAVENSYTQADEGKVVKNGALVAQSSQSITQNGTYDTTEKNEVVVNISGDDIGSNKWLMHLLNNKTPVDIYNEFVIPSSVTELGFYDSSYNQGSRILTMIPARKFSGAEVTEIRSDLWARSKFVEELDFPECVRIGSNIAEYASNLVRINFPKLQNMDNGFAFARCTSLTSVYLPELVMSGRGLLTEDTSLASIRLPKLREITGGASAMYGVACVDLCFPALQRPNQDMLNNCPNLANLSFPALTTIGKSCMTGCPNLMNLFLPGSTLAPMANADTFNNTPLKALTGTIWVNDDLVNGYKTATNWAVYSSIIRPISEYTGSFDYLHA